MIFASGDYEFDDDPGRVDAGAVWQFLSTQAYWGRFRARPDFEAQLASAWRVVGVYETATGRQVGFARAVSDGVEFAYLTDVFILPEARGAGLGRGLVAAMVDRGPGAGFRWALHTADAHGLYREYGFAAPDETYMERRRPVPADREDRPMTESRPPFPPFDLEGALKKVQAAEDAWNTRDPEKVSLAYTPDSVWRNRHEHVVGREQIVAFLARKWERELDYALRKNLWSFTGNRIAVRFQYESHDADGQWWRSYGNELWEFAPNGLMARREASINDRAITPAERRIFGPRPESERGKDFPPW